MATDPRNLGPDGKDVDVSGEHLDQATACLSTATARRDVETVAQAIANAEARGFHAIDRPDSRRIDHGTTAHRLRGALVDALDAEGRVPTAPTMDEHERATAAALADAYTAGRADQLAEQTLAALVLTVEQLAEVRRLFYGMPYLGSVGQRAASLPDGVALVDTLRALQRVLQVVGRQQSDAHTELQHLRAERTAAREYLAAGLLGLLSLAKAEVPAPLEAAHRAERPAGPIPLREEAAQMAADQAAADAAEIEREARELYEANEDASGAAPWDEVGQELRDYWRGQARAGR